jgi:hypothetical protein
VLPDAKALLVAAGFNAMCVFDHPSCAINTDNEEASASEVS